MDRVMTSDVAPSRRSWRGRDQQRKWRNLLVDAAFQLKYASYAIAITIFLSAVLGAVLWKTSARMVQESQKVTQVIEMTIAEDPDYAELLGGAGSEYRSELKAYHDRMRTEQQHYGLVLVSGLGLFVLGLGLAAIVLTHQVAGPVYKLKRELTALGDGSLRYPVPIRKHDELQDVFVTFNEVVGKLRAGQQRRADRLAELIESVEDKLGPEELSLLRALRDEQLRSLRP